mgnify:CR=1 FL=1
MFFKSSETKKASPTTTPDKTVYLLGYSSQSLYLSYHLQNNGYSPIILETPDKALELGKDEFTIKEDRLLQRSKFSIQTSYQMQRECCLLIIPQTSSPLKTKLLLLSPAKLKNAHVIFLDFEEDMTPLVDFLQKPVIRGTMSCFIEFSKRQITLSGRQPTRQLRRKNAENGFWQRQHKYRHASGRGKKLLERVYSLYRGITAVGGIRKKHLRNDQKSRRPPIHFRYYQRACLCGTQKRR